jgi:hypothetical protein
MNRIRNSWNLFAASLNVLKADKELLVFPLISAVGLVLVTITFMLPLLLGNVLDGIIGRGLGAFETLIGLAYYLVQYTIIFFANTALVGAAMVRLRGGDPTLKDGLRIATSRLIPILGYALISATVGIILRWISERSSTLGRFIASLVGLAWNVASYLVVPVLAVEDVGPVEAIKRSAALLKQTWGEQIVGNFGFGLISFIVTMVTLGAGGIGVILALQTSAPLLAAAIVAALAVLVLVLWGLVSSALNGIYLAAVYQYAAEGQTAGFFDPELVKNAFRVQEKRSLV